MTVPRYLRYLRLAGLAAIVACCANTGCGGDRGANARWYLTSGDTFMRSGDTTSAILQYRNALKQEASAEAHYKLALAYERAQKPAEALREFLRVTQLEATNADADMRVARALTQARQFSSVEQLTKRVLVNDPRRVEALTLLAFALRGQNRSAEAARHINEALTIDSNSLPALIGRAGLEADSRNWTQARATLREAITRDASSIEAWLALATMEWRAGRLDAARAAFDDALRLAPDDRNARRQLAAFHLATGRADLAEPHYTTLAATSSRDRLSLADFYLATGRTDEAKALLVELRVDQVVGGQARLRRAALLWRSGDRGAAHEEANHALADPTVEPAARLMKSELLLEDGDDRGALREAEQVTGALPGWADAHYAVGVIQRKLGNDEEAERAFLRARDRLGRPSPADLQLVDLALSREDPLAAVSIAARAANDAPHPFTHAALARAQRASGDLHAARGTVTDARRRWPAAAVLDVELGYVELAVKNAPAAQRAFARALRSTPASPEGRYGLVAARVASGQLDAARAAVDEWRAGMPDDGRLALLSARLDVTSGNYARARETLLSALARNRRDVEALQILAQLYLTLGEKGDALRTFELLLEYQPRSVRTLTIAGLLNEEAGDSARARKHYEAALDADPQAGVAANNLAWLLAKEGQLREALDRAIAAELALNGAPQAVDTLGWMYHLSGRHQEAIHFLKSARNAMPANPTYHYHLGAAYLQAGRTEDAREALARALRLSTTFDDEADARVLLSSISATKR